MRDKTKEKDKSFRLREILIVVIFAAVALAVGGITVINYLRSGDSDTPDLSWSSYEECVNSFGEYALPEEKNSYYVYFPSTEKVSIVKSEDISSVGGYVYEGNKSHIQITCPLGSGEVVGYSETLEDDISEVFNLKTSARLNLESDGLERRFVNYILFKTYPSSCIISGGKCFRFSLSGREEITSYENYRELFVSDTIDDGVMTLIEKFAYIENIKIADCGDYFCSSEGIYDKNAVNARIFIPLGRRIFVPRYHRLP